VQEQHVEVNQVVVLMVAREQLAAALVVLAAVVVAVLVAVVVALVAAMGHATTVKTVFQE
jgi:hypothetical protein